METNIKLYTLNYYEVRTYLLALAFVACNMVLPQVFHLIPQGGFILNLFHQGEILRLSSVLSNRLDCRFCDLEFCLLFVP